MKTTINLYDVSAFVGDTLISMKVLADTKSTALVRFSRLNGQPTSDPRIKCCGQIPNREVDIGMKNANRIAKLECLGGYRPLQRHVARFTR